MRWNLPKFVGYPDRGSKAISWLSNDLVLVDNSIADPHGIVPAFRDSVVDFFLYSKPWLLDLEIPKLNRPYRPINLRLISRH